MTQRPTNHPTLIPVIKHTKTGERTYHVRPDSPRHRFDARAVTPPVSAVVPDGLTDHVGRERVEILAENLQRPQRERRSSCRLGAWLLRAISFGRWGR